MLYQVIIDGQSWDSAVRCEACDSQDAASGAVWSEAVAAASNFAHDPLVVLVRPDSVCDGQTERFHVKATISVTASPAEG